MKNQNNYYLGLDIGTDSVGYAVTDEKYNLIKYKGEPLWGVTLFDQASLCDERRAFRSARRRLNRKKQRLEFLQEIFAKEIANVDERFFIRLKESFMYREDSQDEFTVFDDVDYNDKNYHEEYPTIHHLISELIRSTEPHDIRLIYLACAWLVSHRGHFLSNISIENLASIKNFDKVYEGFLQFFYDNGYDAPWECSDINGFGEIIKKKIGITQKNKEMINFLFEGKKPSKDFEETFPFNREVIIKLLAGGKSKLKDLFFREEYEELGSISLDMDDEKFNQLMTDIGDDYALISALRAISDWAVLVEVLGDYSTISEAKVAVFEEHRKDLKNLKYLIKKYVPEKYDEMFRATDKDNYAAYSYHPSNKKDGTLKKKGLEEFCKYVSGIIGKIEPDAEDKQLVEEMLRRIDLRIFMPKQKNTDNRVIPYQLYLFELITILERVAGYYSFFSEEDEDGLSNSDKIISIFKFKIPYFVGPLNNHSDNAWVVRKQGKIYPWNFDKMIDFDASEQAFIQRMTNRCTYLPGEPVLPKDSLAYHKFTVLNELNNLRVNEEKISVELKQDIYNDVFMSKKKVTRKFIEGYLVNKGIIRKDEGSLLTGVDININSNLSSQISFKRLMDSGVLSETDVEKIIERASYAEDNSRLAIWLDKNYGALSDEDKKYICSLKIKDFGRLSRKFLCEMAGVSKESGEILSIMEALWTTQDNLMEILSEKYTFSDEIKAINEEYYADTTQTLVDKLDEMYISNSVRRPIYRTFDVVKDIQKALGEAPKRIFIETTRGASPDKKGKRTKTRKEQILELYQQCNDNDVKQVKQQLEAMGEYADNKLQGDKLFLYYMQLGKCMYSGKDIELDKLGTKLYDIDHIYPQALVKDDSIINNKVLVLSKENGAKKDIYPIEESVRGRMKGYWSYLKESGLISEEKYKRLVREKPFTEAEKMGFINRQLTETSQSTKAIATLLQERFPETEVVYSKARLVAEFRKEFDLYKSRLFNDLHHAVDAYLNVVVGNVYHMKFSKQWFNVNSNYSVKTKTLFTRPLECKGETIWDGEEMLKTVKNTAVKNTAHFTKFAFYKRGGLYDQNPIKAAPGLVPLKKGLDTEKYGGYNKSGAMFYIPVRYKAKNKEEVLVMSVEMMHGKQFLEDESFAKEYSFARLQHILGKPVYEVSFPMGMRPWKVNTVLSLDGFRVCITGIGSGGKTLIAQSIMQFSESGFWQYYVKKLEVLAEKVTKNPNYIYDAEFDKVTKENNVELYDIYLNKHKNSIYRKRVNSPASIIENGRGAFLKLDIIQQTNVLLSIHQTFGRLSSGCDLQLIGGSARSAATVNFSSTISNWKKNYSDVRIIDMSAAGIWEKKSINLLELI